MRVSRIAVLTVVVCVIAWFVKEFVGYRGSTKMNRMVNKMRVNGI